MPPATVQAPTACAPASASWALRQSCMGHSREVNAVVLWRAHQSLHDAHDAWTMRRSPSTGGPVFQRALAQVRLLGETQQAPRGRCPTCTERSMSVAVSSPDTLAPCFCRSALYSCGQPPFRQDLVTSHNQHTCAPACFCSAVHVAGKMPERQSPTWGSATCRWLQQEDIAPDIGQTR